MHKFWFSAKWKKQIRPNLIRIWSEFPCMTLLHYCKHGRTASGDHGLPKVLLRPTMPYLLRPAGGPPLKRPHSRFSCGSPCGRPVAAFFPFGRRTSMCSRIFPSSLESKTSWTWSVPKKGFGFVQVLHVLISVAWIFFHWTKLMPDFLLSASVAADEKRDQVDNLK